MAQLLHAGAPVLDGFVLPADAKLSSEEAGAQLRQLVPNIEHWILRSSSPLEDRPEHSAAGLFTTLEASAAELGPALQRVRASAASAQAIAILGAESALAVLAQPWRPARVWLTVEVRPPLPLRLEGWQESAAERQPIPRDEADAQHWRGELAHLQPWFEPEESWPGTLLEVLQDGESWWILQKRPAPRADWLEPQLWQLDHEHCVRPLCPLLADLLSRSTASTDSRLERGVWYVRPSSAATPSEADVRAALAASEAKLDSIARDVERLRHGFSTMGADVGAYRRGVERWLQLHAAYFERLTAVLRIWLASHPATPGALSRSLAQRRGRVVAALGADRGPRWREILQKHGHASIWPWDGRGRTAWEDESLLAQWATPGEYAITALLHSSLSDDIALHLEDDDDVLARLYAIFRLALRAIWQKRVRADSSWEDALELQASDLFYLLEVWDEVRFGEALARGRVQAAEWAAALGAAEPAALRGHGVLPGRVSGPACIRATALEGGPPPRNCILVVATISPFDAIVFPRIAGLAVEAPERLSHAAILAREHGVPTVVGLAGARARFADAQTLLLDAAAGTLEAPPA